MPSVTELQKNMTMYGSSVGLTAIKLLLEKAGNPESNLKVIHVAGTNGKGSVCQFLASVFIESGYQTGSYSSPCVFSKYENISVNNKEISKTEFEILFTKYNKIADDLKLKGIFVSFFDIETAIAFSYFNQCKCDICIIECGLGGADDSTNIIFPLASIITSLSLDHTNILGNTIRDIASAKSGIIKNNIPTFTTIQDKNALEIIKNCCNHNNSKLTVADIGTFVNFDKNFQSIKYKDEVYKSSMLGLIQLSNLPIALDVCEYFKKEHSQMYPNLTAKSIVSGIQKAHHDGRFQIICQNPLIIIDGAHNLSAISKLFETLNLYFPNKKIVTAVGIFSDKDFEGMATIISENSKNVICFDWEHERALSAKTLCKYFTHNKNSPYVADTPLIAYKQLKSMLSNDCIGVVCGSLSHLQHFKSLSKVEN